MRGLILNFAQSWIINPDILWVTQKMGILHGRGEKTQTYMVRINVLWIGVLSYKTGKDGFADSVSNSGNPIDSDLFSELFHTRTVPILNIVCVNEDSLLTSRKEVGRLPVDDAWNAILPTIWYTNPFLTWCPYEVCSTMQNR